MTTKVYWEGNYVCDLNHFDAELVSEKKILEHLDSTPKEQKHCYHDLIICSCKPWFFGLLGPKEWVIRCFLCDYSSETFPTKILAVMRRNELEAILIHQARGR